MTDTDTESELPPTPKRLRDNWDYLVQLVVVGLLWIWAMRMSPPESVPRMSAELEYLRFIAAVLTVIGMTLLFVLVNQHRNSRGGDDD